MSDWQPIETAPEGVVIQTMVVHRNGPRNVQPLVKRTREPGVTRPMFWTEDGAMYVYYTPTHWQPLPPSGEGDA